MGNLCDMERADRKVQKVGMDDRIMELLANLKRRQFTGVLILKLGFSGGGIRTCEKTEEERIG